MNMRFLALLGLATAALTGFGAQAQAMKLLVAVGNPQIQIKVSAEGTLEIVQDASEQIIQISSVEPAAGAQDKQVIEIK